MSLILHMHKNNIGSVSTLPVDLIREMYGYFVSYPATEEYEKFLVQMRDKVVYR